MVEWYISKNLKGGFFLKDEKDFKASAAEAEEKIEAELDKSEDYEQQRLNEELEKLAETFRAEMKKAKEENKNAADFCRRFRCYSSILSQTGITAAPPHVWNPSPVARASGTVGFMNSNVRKKPKTK